MELNFIKKVIYLLMDVPLIPYPPERQSAAAFGRQRQDPWTKGLAGNNHDRHARYHLALASPTGS